MMWQLPTLPAHTTRLQRASCKGSPAPPRYSTPSPATALLAARATPACCLVKHQLQTISIIIMYEQPCNRNYTPLFLPGGSHFSDVPLFPTGTDLPGSSSFQQGEIAHGSISCLKRLRQIASNK